MPKKLFAYTVIGLVFTALQYAWLQFAARGIYQRALEPYAYDNVSLPFFLLFCLVFAVGLAIFSLRGKPDVRLIGDAVFRAAIYGALIFALFHLKNMQFLSDWQLGISLIDTVWGAVAASASVAIAIIAADKIKQS
jgi:uncharacterized membrane protein